MRYGLVAGGALLLLLALLGVAFMPGGSAGRRTSAEARVPGTDTGPGSWATDLTDSESAVLRGQVQDAFGTPVAAQVLAFEAGPTETQEDLERRVASGALQMPARATTPAGPDGAFALRVPEGRYHLLAEVGGRTPRSTWWDWQRKPLAPCWH